MPECNFYCTCCNFDVPFSVTGYSTKDELKSFLRESALMKHFDHPNVLGLIGICLNTPDRVPYIVLQYMANGDLRTFLKNKRAGRTSVNQLPQVGRDGENHCGFSGWGLCCFIGMVGSLVLLVQFWWCHCCQWENRQGHHQWLCPALVLSLPPCPGSDSGQAPADVPANSMWDGLPRGVEICAQRPSSKELHVRVGD